MPLSEFFRLGAQLPIGIEWIILLIIIAILLLFGPQKLPELARSIGKAWGELRRGKMEVERQIQSEFGDQTRDVASRIRDAARELGIESAGRRDGELKLEIARRIDGAQDDKVAFVARLLGVTESGASTNRLRELIIKSLGV